eukprot:7319792-Alexandrium_andersonii.AAC.2
MWARPLAVEAVLRQVPGALPAAVPPSPSQFVSVLDAIPTATAPPQQTVHVVQHQGLRKHK